MIWALCFVNFVAGVYHFGVRYVKTWAWCYIILGSNIIKINGQEKISSQLTNLLTIFISET